MRQRAAVRCADVWRAVRGRSVVAWFDNFVKIRNFVDPSADYQVLSCTPITLLTLPVAPEWRTAMPTVRELRACRVSLVNALKSYYDVFVAAVRVLSGVAFDAGDLRVPLDVPRAHAVGPRWVPFAVSEDPMTTQVGLV